VQQKVEIGMWQDSSVHIEAAPDRNDTHLLADRRLAYQPRPILNVPEVTPENFRRRLYNFLCLKLRGY